MCLEKTTYPQKIFKNEVVQFPGADAKHARAQELSCGKSLFYMDKMDLSTEKRKAYLLLLFDISRFK